MTTVKLWSGVCATLFIIGLQSDVFGAPQTTQRDAPAGQVAGRTDGSKLTVADREASDFVQSKINESWIKAPDGWTTRFQAHNLAGQVVPGAPQLLLKQYRELTFSIQPETVTATQRLNGADYRAAVEFKNSSVRYFRTVQTFDGPKGWSPWADGTPAVFVVVERRNGKWLISNTDLFDGVKPIVELQSDVSGAPQTAQRPAAPAGQRPAASAEPEWLSLCGQCLNPSVTAKTGIGTANAVAEAKVTREDAARWCNNWQPAANAQACIQEQLASETAKKTYRAAASCPAGRILSVDGKTYALAGMWTSDVGKGRSQWRDGAGNIVGQDNASGGLAISQQWEMLCPGPIQATALAAAQQSARAPTSSGAGQTAQRPPAAPATGPRPAAPVTASGPSVCEGQPQCTETLSFAARITDFQALLQNRNSKTLTVRMSLQNKLNRPLVLGYVSGTGIATDDRGNRYVPGGERAVQGIGLIQGNAADSKFVLQPGETSDARFEFMWNTSGQEIFGLAFQLELALREINLLPGNQIQLGAERALRFTGLGNRDVAAAPTTTPRTTAVPAPAGGGAAPVAAAPAVDACAGRPRCYSAGPFVSEVTGMTSSIAGSYHLVQVKLRFRNLTNQPIILAYAAGSAVMTDNNGGRYTIEAAPNLGAGARGIGLVQGVEADSQFALAPGASGDTTFTLAKYRPASSRDPVGSVFSLDLTIPQLEVLASRQVRTVREYSVGLTGISASAAGRAAPAVSSVAPSPAGNAPPEVDACGGKPRCYSAGPFVSEVTGITSSVSGSYHLVQAKVRFRNLTNQPITLAYAAGSAVMTDNNGGRYTIEAAPTLGAGARGIGLAESNKVDPQFVLRPGASREATFTLAKYHPASSRDPVGSTFNLDLTIPQVEVLASRQIETVREYAVSFSDLALSRSVGGLLNGILQGLPK